MQVVPFLYVADNGVGGRGVFTASPLEEGTIIEICPVIVCKPSDKSAIDQTDLYNYYFLWGEQEDRCALALGYGSLYNHSFHPNSRYLADYEMDTLSFYALRRIEAGEEITVNYNGLPEIQDALWFKDKG